MAYAYTNRKAQEPPCIQYIENNNFEYMQSNQIGLTDSLKFFPAS